MSQPRLLPFPDRTTESTALATSRIRDRGAGTFTHEELFTYLIGPNAAALMASERPIRWIGADYRALRSKGLDDEQAIRLLACVEFARRMARTEVETRQVLNRPDLVAQYLFLRHARAEQEVMGAVFLDVKNRLIADEVLLRGALDRLPAYPRPILKRALELDAASFVLFHTHPSGDPAPSSEDLGFTRRVSAAAEVLGLKLHDHLILGDANRWVSLSRSGGW